MGRSYEKVVKMTERFTGVARRNFSKYEVNVVKLSLQDKIVLEF